MDGGGSVESRSIDSRSVKSVSIEPRGYRRTEDPAVTMLLLVEPLSADQATTGTCSRLAESGMC